MCNVSLMCYSLLVCDWSVLHIIPLCVSWLLQESAGSNTCRCRWPLPCTCCVKSSCGSRIVLASLALPSKEAYSWEQKHIQGIQSFGPRILLCVTDSFCCAYLVVQSTAVPGLDFQFSTVHYSWKGRLLWVDAACACWENSYSRAASQK